MRYMYVFMFGGLLIAVLAIEALAIPEVGERPVTSELFTFAFFGGMLLFGIGRQPAQSRLEQAVRARSRTITIKLEIVWNEEKWPLMMVTGHFSIIALFRCWFRLVTIITGENFLHLPGAGLQTVVRLAAGELHAFFQRLAGDGARPGPHT
jgi:hypothetical protein